MDNCNNIVNHNDSDRLGTKFKLPVVSKNGLFSLCNKCKFHNDRIRIHYLFSSNSINHHGNYSNRCHT